MAPRRTLAERELVLQMHERGNSYSEISAVLGISRSTCHAIVRRFTMRGHLRDAPSQGRPRILDERGDREVVRLLNAPSNGTAAAVGREMRSQGLDLSDDTIRRCLQRQGLRARVKTKKPFLSKKHKARRYAWAKKCRHASWMDWSYVVFSDESKFNLFGSDGRQYCWRKRGEHLLDQHVQPTIKFGGGNIMVWGCMTWEGVGNLRLIEGNMDKFVYREILEMELMNTIYMHDLGEENVIFQHDNDPKHTSKYVTDWLLAQKFQLIWHPAQSPDLNPIEHLWNEVDRRMRMSKKKPTNKKDLWEKLQEIWYSIEIDTVRKLIMSMPERAADVYQAKGGYTRW